MQNISPSSSKHHNTLNRFETEAIVLVQNILNTISGSVGTSNIDDILKRSEEMLAEIKRNDFGKNQEEARNELEQATDSK